jgi:hypothetical protein
VREPQAGTVVDRNRREVSENRWSLTSPPHRGVDRNALKICSGRLGCRRPLTGAWIETANQLEHPGVAASPPHRGVDRNHPKRHKSHALGVAPSQGRGSKRRAPAAEGKQLNGSITLPADTSAASKNWLRPVSPARDQPLPVCWMGPQRGWGLSRAADRHYFGALRFVLAASHRGGDLSGDSSGSGFHRIAGYMGITLRRLCLGIPEIWPMIGDPIPLAAAMLANA